MKNSPSGNGVRLQKVLAAGGVASRRKSEDIIKQGRVTVNDIVVTEMGTKVGPHDCVKVDGVVVSTDEKVYIVLNKPVNVLCTHSDPLNRKTVYDIIDYKKSRLFSLGRLDYKSCGLLVLTNDGDFANDVIHPSSNIIKEYLVKSKEDPSDTLIKSFTTGIVIDGIRYKAHKIQRTKYNNVLSIFLKEGKKREIREVYKKFNIHITMLKRVALGNLRLDTLHIKPGEHKIFSLRNIKSMIF